MEVEDEVVATLCNSWLGTFLGAKGAGKEDLGFREQVALA